MSYSHVVDVNSDSQLVTVALAVLAIIWNQQRSTDKLRDRPDASDREHRAAIDKLRDGLGEVKERVVRIEGFLGIGTPTPPPSRPPVGG